MFGKYIWRLEPRKEKQIGFGENMSTLRHWCHVGDVTNLSILFEFCVKKFLLVKIHAGLIRVSYLKGYEGLCRFFLGRGGARTFF